MKGKKFLGLGSALISEKSLWGSGKGTLGMPLSIRVLKILYNSGLTREVKFAHFTSIYEGFEESLDSTIDRVSKVSYLIIIFIYLN